MSGIRFRSALLAFFFSLPAVIASQTESTLRAKTELVVVPTLVRDSSGKAISGMRKEDFVLLEDGRPQPIAVFEETVTSNKVGLEATTAGEYSNALETDAAQKRLTIVVLDMLNTTFQDQTYAREQLLKYLSQSVDAREPTALFALGRKGLVRLHDLTQDPRSLVIALQRVSGEAPQYARATRGTEAGGISRELTNIAAAVDSNSKENPPGTDPILKDALETAERLMVFRNGGEGEYAALQERVNVGQTLAAFQQIAHAYEAVPGRKSLIWATGGFPFGIGVSGNLSLPAVFSAGTASMNLITKGSRYDQSGGMPSLPESSSLLQGSDLAQLTPVYERTLQLLTNANIAVYPVDARGLVAFSTDATRGSINQGLTQDLRGQQFSSQTSMEGMANATGGKAFYNRNDLSRGFRLASDDGVKYYTLGYYRDRSQRAGWHKIEVEVKQPGLQVRSRRGYIVPQNEVSSKTARLLDVATAMTAPVNFSGVPFFVKWKAQTQDKKGKVKVEFDMWIPPDKKAGEDQMNLEILAAVQDGKGQIMDQMGQVLGKDMKPETIAQIRQHGMSYNNHLSVPAGSYKVKFIVRDNVTGRLGSLQIPLEVN